VNPLFTDPLGQPLTEPPSMRYFDAYSSYKLPTDLSTTQYFCMNSSFFGIPIELGNLYFSTNIVIDTVGTSYLLETPVTQITLTQPIPHASPFTYG
jgi:hypothetical protein